MLSHYEVLAKPINLFTLQVLILSGYFVRTWGQPRIWPPQDLRTGSPAPVFFSRVRAGSPEHGGLGVFRKAMCLGRFGTSFFIISQICKIALDSYFGCKVAS